MGLEINSAVLRRLAAGVTAIAMLVGAATLLGFLARYGWSLELLSHFRVQYFWLLAGCGCALITLRRGKLATCGLVLALVNLVLIVPLYFGPAPPPGERATLRAMMLNVYWLNRDHARVLELIRRESPDFIMLAEVTDEWAEALTALQTDYPYSKVISGYTAGGVAFFSRLEMAELAIRDLGDNGLPTVVATLKTSEGEITVVGTHPPSPGSPQHLKDRNRQLAGLGRMVRNRTGPIIVLGDLNTTSWSPYFQDLLAASGLRDSRRGFGIQASWPALPLPLRIPIDHCLISKELLVHDRRIGPSVGSDHRAVIVDFSVQK